jgi:putative CocE/NonD family hydrolase
MMRRGVVKLTIGSLIVAVLANGALASGEQARVSRPGAYEGYSPVLYDDYLRSSQYVTVRDGTKIAIDIFRPARGGRPVETRLPVVWMNTPYNRRTFEGGETVRTYPGAALALVKYGYVVAIADMRGGYASFGKAVTSNRTEWMPYAYWDAYDITEWLAAQPWSSGRIGMWGCSATGHTQWQAAASRPPHLRAIMPLSAPSEYYDWGGIAPVIEPPPQIPAYPGPVPARDAEAAPVDDDPRQLLLAAAKEEHRWNTEPGYMPFRDSASPNLAAHMGLNDFRYWLEVSTFPHMAAISRSGIAIYQSANYGEDIRVKLGVFVKHRNVGGTIKTVVGPGKHCSWTSPFDAKADNPFDITVEERRWFDRWLKGIDNGVTEEPPITYYTYNAPAGSEWRSAWQWPLPTERRTGFYLGEGRSLTSEKPAVKAAADRYTVDYTATLQTVNDKGLTYTSAPMPEDTVMTGHPVLELWISSTARDGDYVANLFDIAPDGTATALPGTEDGRLRASHRAVAKPPYDNLGLPWHRSFRGDVKPLVAGQPTKLSFDLAPVSWVFRKGHRIRLALANVAASRRGQGGLTPVMTPPPTVNYLRDAAHPSRLVLPLSAPVSAAATLRRSKTGTVARIAFPASLDARYVADIDPASVTLGGVSASRVRIAGRGLTAEFPTGARGVIGGRFGRKYGYGDQARFVASTPR